MVAPVLPPMFLPNAVPATLPKALAAATRAVLSACAFTVIIEPAAKTVLIKSALSFMSSLRVHQQDCNYFDAENVTNHAQNNMKMFLHNSLLYLANCKIGKK
ncbi:MAG: hypothetical protein ACD_6C00704G0003 [uncultured bacterium]|nr:MAG: hypothetical protein ACD_6C00704G0003 [uncultured bacterium]